MLDNNAVARQKTIVSFLFSGQRVITPCFERQIDEHIRIVILDANITTFIAAVALSLLGKGPVQGFANTLAIGIVSSLITALFVSRLIFDFATDVLRVSRLSIMWRRVQG